MLINQSSIPHYIQKYTHGHICGMRFSRSYIRVLGWHESVFVFQNEIKIKIQCSVRHTSQ